MLTSERETEYSEHMERKVESRTEKAKDKKEAQESDNLYVATFDMEVVLPTPFDLTSQTYYKRKLSTYNLSVFSLADKKAACYVWNGSEGQRGSNEVGTCLYKHILSLPQSVQHVILYSDTCTGQNRNQFITAALHHAVQNIPNIQTIDQKFLESGHSQMECDSMHVCIERSRRGVRIHQPDQWITVIQCARDSDPYTVVTLEHDAFYDFKELARNTMRNTKHDINNRRVNWLKLKWIRVTKADTDTVYFNYRMKDQFSQIKIKGTSRRGRPQVGTTSLSLLYTSQLPIPNAKKADLTDLCRSGVIPSRHHEFYSKLPSSSTVRDCLAEVDVTEENDETDDD
ncbi:hypothetical protein BaRGS_00034087 [Batillaria attramentaria]|uniref:DUF7869 domain-containing protein n=1 Tax=Batillaria attramentaria TaxID=370345 RepID=A0ABD0JIX1_9CAEN